MGRQTTNRRKGHQVRDKPDEAPARHRREKREDVRSKILAAAVEVFATRGYEDSSLKRVAAQAGFSKGAVYSNFENKDELFFELVASRIDERIEAVRLATEKKAASVGKMPKAGAGTGSSANAVAIEAVARLAGKVLREMGEADPAWQGLFLEFWLRCARNDAMKARLADLRREMRGRIADLIVAEAKAAGARIGRSEAMDIATTALALSNGLGIEGIIDPKAAPPRLLGEILSRVIAGSSIAKAVE
jgi:AcrR family transcriptional regulator